MSDILKMLRYNTGTDKKMFIKFKNQFDAAIFNATIVAFSGSSIADLISSHASKYIIDPQTHIFQQEKKALLSSQNKDKITGDTKPPEIKESISKYLSEYPLELKLLIEQGESPLSVDTCKSYLDDIVDSVFRFETEFVNKYIKEKEYNKYLEYAGIELQPKLLIAPYFMLKASYSKEQCFEWLSLNKAALEAFISKGKKHSKTPVAAQLVIDKKILDSIHDIKNIVSYYNIPGFEYIFLWVSDFNSFEESENRNIAFSQLIKEINAIGKKPVMAYGGYESIMLCSQDSPFRLYGVAQSVGYGEYRSITPVGGGVPINKYYFYPIHVRLKANLATDILLSKEYFSTRHSKTYNARRYYKNICDCDLCKEVIADNIDNFQCFTESKPFPVKLKSGEITRSRATTEAIELTAEHFLNCKIKEWRLVESNSFKNLIKLLLDGYKEYSTDKLPQIESWMKIYGN